MLVETLFVVRPYALPADEGAAVDGQRGGTLCQLIVAM